MSGAAIVGVEDVRDLLAAVAFLYARDVPETVYEELADADEGLVERVTELIGVRRAAGGGADPTAAALQDEIAAARRALLEVVWRAPGCGWRAYALKQEARGRLSGGALSLALNRLINEGALVAEGDVVRLGRGKRQGTITTEVT